MDVTIIPNKLQGTVTPPSSKSVGHRALIAAALSGGVSRISRLTPSQDMEATLSCLTALGTGVEWTGPDQVAVHGLGNSIPQRGPFPRLDCGESGSTLRFLIPVALAVSGGEPLEFTGRGRLMERPQGPYFSLFQEKGIFYQQKDGVLTVRGTLKPGIYSLPGDVSSQFITGLLFALPLLDGDSDLVLTSPLESRGYVDLTLDVLNRFGIQIEKRENGFHVPGNQSYRAVDLTVEADWSQAAFWYAANFLGGEVDILGLDPRSAQGDMAVSEHYWRLARPGEAEIDVSGCPDLLPPLAVMAAARNGVTRFTHAARLRMKESDRLRTTAALLAALGGQVEEGPDFLTVRGGPLTGGTVDSANDHRIAMAAAIAATGCTGPVTIRGAECVQKSYPDFWEDYRSLGGRYTCDT